MHMAYAFGVCCDCSDSCSLNTESSSAEVSCMSPLEFNIQRRLEHKCSGVSDHATLVEKNKLVHESMVKFFFSILSIRFN